MGRFIFFCHAQTSLLQPAFEDNVCTGSCCAVPTLEMQLLFFFIAFVYSSSQNYEINFEGKRNFHKKLIRFSFIGNIYEINSIHETALRFKPYNFSRRCIYYTATCNKTMQQRVILFYRSYLNEENAGRCKPLQQSRTLKPSTKRNCDRMSHKLGQIEVLQMHVKNASRLRLSFE